MDGLVEKVVLKIFFNCGGFLVVIQMFAFFTLFYEISYFDDFVICSVKPLLNVLFQVNS